MSSPQRRSKSATPRSPENMIHLRRVKKSEGTLIDFENRLQAGVAEEEEKKGVRAERETLKETSLLFICINRSRDASL